MLGENWKWRGCNKAGWLAGGSHREGSGQRRRLIVMNFSIFAIRNKGVGWPERSRRSKGRGSDWDWGWWMMPHTRRCHSSHSRRSWWGSMADRLHRQAGISLTRAFCGQTKTHATVVVSLLLILYLSLSLSLTLTLFYNVSSRSVQRAWLQWHLMKN